MDPHPRDWMEVVEKVSFHGKVAMVLGAIDTGKTTLATLLANRALELGRKVAIVDTDVGQSNIGPPTTIGLGFAEGYLERISEAVLKGVYFIGDTSPEGDISSMAMGTKEMVDKALALGAELIVIDTTGLVYGDLGRMLKGRKIELTEPDRILLLQMGEELEHLVASLNNRDGIYIYRLPPHPNVKSRSQDDRRKYRQMMMRSYFEKGKHLTLLLREIALPKTSSRSEFKNLLVGLTNRDGELLGLGIVEKIDFDKGEIYLLSSIEEGKEVRELRAGKLHIDPETYEELPMDFLD